MSGRIKTKHPFISDFHFLAASETDHPKKSYFDFISNISETIFSIYNSPLDGIKLQNYDTTNYDRSRDYFLKLYEEFLQ